MQICRSDCYYFTDALMLCDVKHSVY